MTRPLYLDRHEIVAGLLRSGVYRRAEVAGAIDKMLRDKERQAQAARAKSVAYAAKVRAGVRAVAERQPLQPGPLHRWVAVVSNRIADDIASAGVLGLRRQPDRELVREIVRQVRDERARQSDAGSSAESRAYRLPTSSHHATAVRS